MPLPAATSCLRREVPTAPANGTVIGGAVPACSVHRRYPVSVWTKAEAGPPDSRMRHDGSLSPGYTRPGFAGHDDASLLALGSPLASPSSTWPWPMRVAPRLQWRDRAGFAPASCIRHRLTRNIIAPRQHRRHPSSLSGFAGKGAASHCGGRVVSGEAPIPVGVDDVSGRERRPAAMRDARAALLTTSGTN